MTDAAAPTVLLVEDNPGDARLVRALLAEASGRRFHIEHAERLQDAMARLDAGGIDVVLLDMTLPDAQGVASVDAVRGRAPDVPIVVFTGLGDERQAAEAVSRGASGFVVKGRPGTGPLLAEILGHAAERRRTRQTARNAADLLAAALRDLSGALERLPASEPTRDELQHALDGVEKALALVSLIDQVTR